MALKLYYKDEDDNYVEVTPTTPITTTHDGKNGDIKTTSLYLKNDNDTLWYSNVRILPFDTVNTGTYGDVVYAETGWGVKLSSGGTEPTTAEWNDIIWGSEISMSNVGALGASDISTYFPFWYLIACPPNTDAQNKTDIVLRLSYTENAA